MSDTNEREEFEKWWKVTALPLPTTACCGDYETLKERDYINWQARSELEAKKLEASDADRLESPLQYILSKEEWDYFRKCERDGVAMSVIAHRLAIELECLVLDTKDLPIQSKWWDSSMAAVSDWHDMWNKEQPHVSALGKD